MKINWQAKEFDYLNETIQSVVDRMNIHAIYGFNFTIKMSGENFYFIKKCCFNAKFLTSSGLPIQDVVDALVLCSN